MSRGVFAALVAVLMSACAPRMASPPPPICRAPPPPPKVEWLPAGCPPSFGACLSGPDAGALADYLTAARRWMVDARRRCDRVQ